MLNLFSLLFLVAGYFADQPVKQVPASIKGDFTDDYGINYTISDSVWIQHPKTRYYIVSVNAKEHYIIARNAESNATDKNLYTRIDYMTFERMEPFNWGFCLSVYNAKTDKEAEAVTIADRQNPRKGCNGYPFSRMKRSN